MEAPRGAGSSSRGWCCRSCWRGGSSSSHALAGQALGFGLGLRRQHSACRCPPSVCLSTKSQLTLCHLSIQESTALFKPCAR
jgi:hypothetical protein